MSPASIEKQAEAIRQKQKDELRLIDQILAEHVGAIPPELLIRTDDETFRRFFPDDKYLVLRDLVKRPKTIPSECARMAGILKFSGIAGTRKDRADAAARLKAAETALAKEGAKLHRIIADAEQQLRTLTEAERDAAAEVTKRSEALAVLRRYMPLDVKQHLNRRTKEGADQAELDEIVSLYDDGIKG